ncbi:phosphatase PAP2 family protein [Microbulbifer sp. DLAB2-AF]|uniref:phosphatase PAP2 family protein n=1 Tax=Microbulbifer sp. DLAB2-AF TaxID=3243395 RepID=UPI00403907EE
MNLKSIDVSLVLYLTERASRPTSRRRYLWLSKSGDGWLTVAVLLSYIISNAATQLFIAAFSGLAVERSLYWTIKNTTRRRRPPQAIPGMRPIIIAHDRFSLPSGHTSAAFLFITFMTQQVSPMWGLGYIWATGVGAARVGLGVHFPSDIFAGALLGSCVAIATGAVLL